MDNLKILVTGASGFIGSSLIKKLCKSGFEVMALSRTCTEEIDTGLVHWLKADLSLPDTYRDDIKLFNPNVVIHLSWTDIPDFSFEKSKLNLNQSLEFLSFILEIESCKKIIVSGSCLEYNATQGECIESDTSYPKDHFTWAKHSIYSWLSMNCLKKEVNLGWFRLFYVYGPGQRSGALIPTILSSLKRGILPSVRTPHNANDYIFIDDVIEAFYMTITNKISSGIYNLGTGKSTTVLDICHYAEKIVLGSNLLTKQLEKECSQNIPAVNFWAGSAKIKKRLRWSPRVFLENGIKQTWVDLNK